MDVQEDLASEGLFVTIYNAEHCFCNSWIDEGVSGVRHVEAFLFSENFVAPGQLRTFSETAKSQTVRRRTSRLFEPQFDLNGGLGDLIRVRPAIRLDRSMAQCYLLMLNFLILSIGYC